MDLTEFLRARLDEDEKRARDAGESRIAWLTYRDASGGLHYTTVANGRGDVWVADGKELPEPASTLVVYETARVLAEVEAKRKLLGSHYDYRGVCTRCFDWQNKPVEREQFPCEVVRLLALPYADHPDYRAEWRP